MSEFDTKSSAPSAQYDGADQVGPVPGKHTNTELAANGGGGPMPAVAGKRTSTEGLPAFGGGSALPKGLSAQFARALGVDLGNESAGLLQGKTDPMLVIDTKVVTFPPTQIGGSASMRISVRNDDRRGLVLDAVTPTLRNPFDDFTVMQVSSLIFEPGERREIVVTFRPSRAAYVEQTLSSSQTPGRLVQAPRFTSLARVVKPPPRPKHASQIRITSAS